MPKRKRDDGEETGDAEIEDQALRIRVSRLKAKIDQSHKSIATALKLARSFERQKLGRREKTAQQEPKVLLRLREEVIVLKSLDLGKTAKNYLVKQLIKTKRIKESAAFVKVYGTEPEIEGPQSGAEANVVARLFNSNPVKVIMPDIMKGIYGCLGIEGRSLGSKATEQRHPASQTGTKNGDDEEFEGFSEVESLNSGQEVMANGNDSAQEEELSEKDEFAEYSDRLASSSDELDEELGDGQTLSRPSRLILAGQNHDRQPFDEFSGSPDTAAISDSNSSASPPVQHHPARTTLSKPSTTAFLPSLAGGYYSGSDDDNDDEADRQFNNSNALPQIRKNRRGQRARQQIAEKKYGKSAKHLAKAGKQVVGGGRDAGWDAQKGATDGSAKRGKFGRAGGSRFPRKTQGPTGANADLLKDRKSKSKSDGPLHPSWEAAKKRKQEQKPMLAFSGKKITFD